MASENVTDDMEDERDAMERAELRAELARENGVFVSVDDPIMVFYTVTRRLSIQFANRLGETFDEFRPTMEEMYRQWSLEAKEKAERVLTASVNANRKMIDDTAKMFTENAAIEFKKALKPLLDDFRNGPRKIETQGKNALYASYIALASSGLSLFAVLYLLYRTFGGS